jgi:hypothetical protein
MKEDEIMKAKIFLHLSGGLVLFLLGGFVMDQMIRAQQQEPPMPTGQRMKVWPMKDGDWDYWSDSNVLCPVELSDKVGIGTANPSPHADLTLEGGVLCLKETVAPNGDPGYGKIYTKDSKQLYFQDGAGTEKILTASFTDYAAGEYVDNTDSSTVRSTGNTTMTKLKEITPLEREGVVDVSYDVKHATVNPGYGSQLYINGQPYGIAETEFDASWRTITNYSVPVNQGDILQVYGYALSGSNLIYAKNLNVKCSNPTRPAEVTGY